jgi:hypothetical protein
MTSTTWGVQPLPIPSSEARLNGPTEGETATIYAFACTILPPTVTLPIQYVWWSSGHTPVTQTAGLSDTVAFAWDLPGLQSITVTATNIGGAVTATHMITVAEPSLVIHLPLILRAAHTTAMAPSPSPVSLLYRSIMTFSSENTGDSQ